MKYFFIMNPGSHGGESKQLFDEVFSILNCRGVDYSYRITEKMDDAYEFSRKANKDNYDVIVAIGGDGTINQVVNGFYDDKGRRLSMAKLGIVYAGTSPDICKHYNLPVRDVKTSMELFLRGQSRKIEIGKVILARKKIDVLHNKPARHDDQFNTKYFIGCLNVGLGAMICRNNENGIRHYLGDIGGTFVSMIRSLLSYKQTAQKLRIDDKEVIIDSMMNITVGKINYIASGMKVATDLKANDGRFFALTFKNASLMKIPGMIKFIYKGEALKNSNEISMEYCRKIEIYGNNEHPYVEFDGDLQGFLPCFIENSEDTIDLISWE